MKSKYKCRTCGRYLIPKKIKLKNGGERHKYSSCPDCNPYGVDCGRYYQHWSSSVANQYPERVKIIYECPCDADYKMRHHFDYSYAYYVFLLCRACNGREHAKINVLSKFYSEKLGIDIKITHLTRFLFENMGEKLNFSEVANGIVEVCEIFGVANDSSELNLSLNELVKIRIDKMRLLKLKSRADSMRHMVSIPKTEEGLIALIEAMKPFIRKDYGK